MDSPTLLRFFKGDETKYRQALADIARSNAQDLAQLRASTSREFLSARPANPRTIDLANQQRPPLSLEVWREILKDPRYLEVLARALLAHEELWRPVFEYLARRPSAKRKTPSAAHQAGAHQAEEKTADDMGQGSR